MPLKLPHVPSKDEMGALLIDHPFFNSIIRVLLFDRLFRTLVVGGVVLVLAVGLFVAKLRTATPPGFEPEIKLSGLNLVQTWFKTRTARQQVANGQLEEGLQTWNLALARNPADPNLVREYLDLLGQVLPTRDRAATGVKYSRWLLRLTATNHLDLELSARLYRHLGLEDLTVDLLAPLGELTPELEAAFLVALFESNQFARFADRWESADRHGSGNSWNSPELALYAAAYQAGWGPRCELGEAQAALDNAKENPDLRILAHRLQLKVSERLVQADSYRQSLKVLEDWRKDRLVDHTVYWQLLTSVGRKSEALKLIGAHPVSSNSGTDLVLLARAYFDLGQPDVSREILKLYTPEFSDSEAIWIAHTNLLIDQQRWNNLLDVALLMRHEDNPLRDQLAAFSYYAEGLGELGKGRRHAAETAFKRVASAPTRNLLWEFIFAERVDTLGFRAAAREILLNLKRMVPDDKRFWALLSNTAFELRQPDLVVAAMTSAYWLRSDDPLMIRNYAAALLAAGQRQDEALRLTSQLMELSPADPGNQIHHALALLQNNRTGDAAAVLQRIIPDQLDDGDQSGYYFATLKLRLAQGRYQEAFRALAYVQVKDLLPAEIQQLELARARLAQMGVVRSAGRSIN